MFNFIARHKLLLLILAGAIILPLFFWGGPDGYSWPVLREFWNLGHFVFFALPGLLWQWWKGPATWRTWLWLSLGAFIVGAAIELVQGFVGRDVDALDVYHDMVGLWLGLAWGATNTRRWQLRVCSLVLLFPALFHLTQVAYAQWHQLQQAPLLNGFESRWDLFFVRGEVVRDCNLATQGQCSLRVELNQDEYSGAKMEFYASDWSHLNNLHMDFYNPQVQPIDIGLRISDLTHERGAHANQFSDRFNQHFLLQPGWNHLQIPLATIAAAPSTRRLDLTQVYQLEFFTHRLAKPAVIFWDDLGLN